MNGNEKISIRAVRNHRSLVEFDEGVVATRENGLGVRQVFFDVFFDQNANVVTHVFFPRFVATCSEITRVLTAVTRINHDDVYTGGFFRKWAWIKSGKNRQQRCKHSNAKSFITSGLHTIYHVHSLYL